MDSEDLRVLKVKPLDVQLDGMLEFLREHPRLAIGERGYGNQYNARLWSVCAEKLNAVADGAQKDGKGWSKFWRSWKYRVSLKEKELHDIMESKKEMPDGLVPLSEREQCLLSLLEKIEEDLLLREDSLSEDDKQDNWKATENEEIGSENEIDPSDDQVQCMLEFLQQHPQTRNSGSSSKLWTQCASKLNGMDGARKKTEGWVKFWNDLKTRVSEKLRLHEHWNNLAMPCEPLTPLEDFVAKVMQNKPTDTMDTFSNDEEIFNNSDDQSESGDVALATLQNTKSTVDDDPFNLHYYHKNKVTNEQMDALLDFMKKHSRLAKGLRRQGAGTDGSHHSPKALWTRCAKILNAFEIGAKKDSEGWSKVWRDLKYQVRQKVLRFQAAKTDSTLPRVSFTDREKLVISLIGKGKNNNINRPHSRASIESDELEYTVDDRKSISGEQMTCLLRFVHEHPELARRTQGSNYGARISVKKLWAQCAKRLNAIEDGAKKNSGRWAKVWRDLKYLARKKALRYKEAMENGGFGAVPLSKREEFILYMIGDHSPLDRAELKIESLSEESDGTQNDQVDNTFGDCQGSDVPFIDMRDHDYDKKRKPKFDSDDEIDLPSKFLKLHKQNAENTKVIRDKLQNVKANMARMTTALFDLTDYLSSNASHSNL